jgi:hypothetical protein
MAYGHAERNLATLRLLEAQTRELLARGARSGQEEQEEQEERDSGLPVLGSPEGGAVAGRRARCAAPALTRPGRSRPPAARGH